MQLKITRISRGIDCGNNNTTTTQQTTHYAFVFTFRSVVGQDRLLTHCGRVTQICVFTLQLCKTDDANLRF